MKKSKWNVSKVTDMNYMFADSEFTGENGDISKWDVSSVEDAEKMFAYSKFNNDISNWVFKPTHNIRGIFYQCPIKAEYEPYSKRV